MAVVMTANTARGTRMKTGTRIWKLSEIEYNDAETFPSVENARMTVTNLPNPPAGVSIAARMPPAEPVSYPAVHDGTFGTAPPIAAPRIISGTVGRNSPRYVYANMRVLYTNVSPVMRDAV